MSLKKAAEQVRAAGRGKDTELVHFTKREVGALEGLAKAAGGRLTRNPETGMVEAGFLDSMLPTLLGIGANFIVPGSGMVVGGLAGAAQNKNDPLMGAALGAMGGYGGGQLAQGLQGLGGSALTPEVLAQASASTDPIMAATAAKDAALAGGVQAPVGFDALQAGVQNTMNNPAGLVNTMGGAMPTAKAAGLAAAPMLYDYMMPGQSDGSDIPKDGEGRQFDYDPGYTGGTMTGPDISSERQWFNSSYTPRMAEGGEVQGKTASGAPAFNVNSDGTFSPKMVAASTSVAAPPAFEGLFGAKGLYGRSADGSSNFIRLMAKNTQRGGVQGQRGNQRYAAGGEVQMSEGGFVIPADVVSMAGNGSSSAGLEAFGTLLGAQPIEGPGDGMSDDIPANIDGRAPARVARQEAYLPPETVARVGGARKLYDMVERVRKMAHGKPTQQRPVDLRKALA